MSLLSFKHYADGHLNWFLPVPCSLFPVPFEQFRYPNLNPEQLNHYEPHT
ncbi:MAG: hypothetical protein F6K56_17825 [Moorea sp. SIO3G5]|nr:hypothetical protein [Moorena sp. SIO3G5]